MSTPNIRHSSSSVEYYTPGAIVEAARLAMGVIDLDPASCALANEIVKATTWFGQGGKVSNGFTSAWSGCIFLNPPGGKCDQAGNPTTLETAFHKHQSSQKAWWFKLASEWFSGRVKQAIFVGFSLEILQITQSKTPCDATTEKLLPIPLDFPCCYPSRRIAYLKAAPETPTRLVVGSSPPHASVLVWLPPRNPDTLPYQTAKATHRFRNAFSPFGAVVCPQEIPEQYQCALDARTR